MTSHDGNYVLVLNGEIYNHLELRRQLETQGSCPPWRGHSDTETLLACMVAWGIDSTLKASVGMFAFALWDKAGRQLFLGRDRFGEKPLYLARVNRGFAFSSELKGFMGLPGFDNSLDPQAVANFMQYGFVTGTGSIYRGAKRQSPGTWLVIDMKTLASSEFPDEQPYWTFLEAAERGLEQPAAIADSEATDALEVHLREAINGQLMADVPLGAFLSGGIDSSTVVALLQSQASSPVKTFSVGFKERAYDEAPFARKIAQHLKTDHTEIYFSINDALQLVPKLPEVYCEPFADISELPTLMICSVARKQVTVALSGDAGDELFGGYTRHQQAMRWSSISRWPLSVRRFAAHGFRAVPADVWDAIYSWVAPLLPVSHRLSLPGEKIHKAAEALRCASGPELYTQLISTVNGSRFSRLPASCTLPNWPSKAKAALTEYMMAMDTMNYLPHDILTKVDRAAMSVGLETRIPFLNHKLVEFAWGLPLSHKIKDGRGKNILRNVLKRHVPLSLFDRPKMGFAVPIGAWLRGPLRDWAQSLLRAEELDSDGLCAVAISRAWKEHQSGVNTWQYALWNVLMFRAWRRHWMPHS